MRHRYRLHGFDVEVAPRGGSRRMWLSPSLDIVRPELLQVYDTSLTIRVLKDFWKGMPDISECRYYFDWYKICTISNMFCRFLFLVELMYTVFYFLHWASKETYNFLEWCPLKSTPSKWMIFGLMLATVLLITHVKKQRNRVCQKWDKFLQITTSPISKSQKLLPFHHADFRTLQ